MSGKINRESTVEKRRRIQGKRGETILDPDGTMVIAKQPGGSRRRDRSSIEIRRSELEAELRICLKDWVDSKREITELMAELLECFPTSEAMLTAEVPMARQMSNMLKERLIAIFQRSGLRHT